MLTLLFDGIAYGMLLFVLAVGLAVTLGLMNFINLAHGAFAMAGGYIAVLLMQRAGLPFLLCLPIAFIVENNGMSVDSPIAERQATPLKNRVLSFGVSECDTVESAVRGARMGFPSLHEAHITLECEHIYLAALAPKIG